MFSVIDLNLAATVGNSMNVEVKMKAEQATNLVKIFPVEMRGYAHSGTNSLARTHQIVDALNEKAHNVYLQKIRQGASRDDAQAAASKIVDSSVMHHDDFFEKFPIKKFGGIFWLDYAYYNDALNLVERDYLNIPLKMMSPQEFHKMIISIHDALMEPQSITEKGSYRNNPVRINKLPHIVGAGDSYCLENLKKHDSDSNAGQLYMKAKHFLSRSDAYSKWKSKKIAKDLAKFINKYFVVCPSHQEVKKIMTELFQDITKKLLANEDPISVAAFAHYGVSSIHPFSDGNGRVSRILMNMILMQGGHQPVCFPYAEYYDNAVKNEERIKGSFATFLRSAVERSDYEAIPVDQLDPQLLQVLKLEAFISENPTLRTLFASTRGSEIPQP